MKTPELPPLPLQLVRDERHLIHEARERILQARIAELEAVLARFDERWLMDGELGFCTACGTSIEGGDAHEPDCWFTEARERAARGKA